jgi:hypothetical protein
METFTHTCILSQSQPLEDSLNIVSALRGQFWECPDGIQMILATFLDLSNHGDYNYDISIESVWKKAIQIFLCIVLYFLLTYLFFGSTGV